MKEQGRFKDKFSREEAKPNRSLWDAVEQNLQKERNKRFAMWWWVPFALFLGSGIVFWMAAPESVFQKEEAFAISHTNTESKEPAIQSPVSAPVQENPSFSEEKQTTLPESDQQASNEVSQCEMNTAQPPLKNQAKDKAIRNQKLRKALKIPVSIVPQKPELQRIAQNNIKPAEGGISPEIPADAKESKESMAFVSPGVSGQPQPGSNTLIETQEKKDSLAGKEIAAEIKPDKTKDTSKPKSPVKYQVLAGAYFANKIQELNRFPNEARQRSMGQNEITAERFSFSLQIMVSRQILKKWQGGLGAGLTYLADKTMIAHRARTGHSEGNMIGGGWEEIKPGFTEVQRQTTNRMGLLDISASIWSPAVAGPVGLRLGGIWSLPVASHFTEQIGNTVSGETTWFPKNSFGSIHMGLPLSLAIGKRNLTLEPQILYPLQSVFDNGFGSRNRPVRCGIQIWMEF